MAKSKTVSRRGAERTEGEYVVRADVPLDVATAIDVLRKEWQKMAPATSRIRALLTVALQQAIDDLIRVAELPADRRRAAERRRPVSASPRVLAADGRALPYPMR